MQPPLSVIIPALDAAKTLDRALSPLTSVIASLLVHEVIVSDGGSTDETRDIAQAAGALLVTGAAGRGQQLNAGAAAATGSWLLFVHADTVLAPGWVSCAVDHMAAGPDAAGAVTLAYDSDRSEARWLERRANRRARWFGLPYGDQGLLISRHLFDEIGGYPDIALMEDVAIVRKIGRRRLRHFPVEAVTSAAKYERDGWRRRAWANGFLLTRYLLGADPAKLARRYE